ncbi:MAG: membrane lipoprotein lipid attachment site-containing protein [Paramuribaculum sp.]|nr:membrane lipoprotein lipid attachment site-containing protein [Paramuribaculum sp.]
MKKIIAAIFITLTLAACGGGDKQAITDVGHARRLGYHLAEAQFQLRQAQSLYGENSPEARAVDSLIVLINDSVASADAVVKQIFREAYQDRNKQLQPKIHQAAPREQQLDDSTMASLQLDEEVTILDPL